MQLFSPFINTLRALSDHANTIIWEREREEKFRERHAIVAKTPFLLPSFLRSKIKSRNLREREGKQIMLTYYALNLTL